MNSVHFSTGKDDWGTPQDLFDALNEEFNFTLAGLETAEAAADIYAAEKHAYSFDGYLYQLEKLKTVLAAGVPSEIALEAVDSCADADAIIKYYRGGTA